MKVINPNDATHSVSIIPRFNDTTTVTMLITDEATKTEVLATSFTYVLTNGIGVAAFDNTLVEKSKYSFKLLDNGTEIIYRGKMLATTQETQDYKLTTDLYFYE